MGTSHIELRNPQSVILMNTFALIHYYESTYNLFSLAYQDQGNKTSFEIESENIYISSTLDFTYLIKQMSCVSFRVSASKLLTFNTQNSSQCYVVGCEIKAGE
ncbi:unnamed protein product [Orchesella dallaii]|uniref:Uncharacterized protein n=1 Tax=Orchesella dallaii TaxID=48710 RepID=A0ABP1QUY0_9HEXA